MSEKKCTMEELERGIRSCLLCPLHATRTNAVPGEGPSSPSIMLIGEAPGRNEDLEGKPFCGSAGSHLDYFLDKANLNRNDIFITSIVKCRPPNNRVPKLEEANACKQNWLLNQIQLLNPKIIGLMGRVAIQHLLGEEIDLGKRHGTLIHSNGLNFFVLYHPAAVIYNQSLKDTIENDFRKLASLSHSALE